MRCKVRHERITSWFRGIRCRKPFGHSSYEGHAAWHQGKIITWRTTP